MLNRSMSNIYNSNEERLTGKHGHLLSAGVTFQLFNEYVDREGLIHAN